MMLRPEFNPPPIDEELVARLAALAEKIDGAQPGEWEDALEEFNRLSPQPLAFEDFQGVHGGDGHDDYVRRLLATHHLPTIHNLSRNDLVSAFERILDPDCPDHEQSFLIDTLAQNLGDPQISDLIFWPGEYFGDGDNFREMTAAQMAEVALARQAKRDLNDSDSGT